MSVHSPPQHGRGVRSDELSTRFNLPAREVDGDWRDEQECVDGPPAKLRTTVTEEHPAHDSQFQCLAGHRLRPFDQCLSRVRAWLRLLLCPPDACLSRPLSGARFRNANYIAKPTAARLLRKTLPAKAIRPKPIAIGTNTDPYQPIEARYRITREVLEVCLETRHPVMITTKSDRVLRDHRLAGRAGAAPAHPSLDLGYQPRCQALRQARTARGDARASGSKPCGGWARQAFRPMSRSRQSSLLLLDGEMEAILHARA